MSGIAGNWYRVADLTPRLRAHAEVHRHSYRGRVWYVLQDHQSGRHFRISPVANALLCLMDGRRTAERILSIAGERFRAERPGQSDLMELLIQLHGADLLGAGLPPDMTELERRAARDRRGRASIWLRNPMAVRLPLLDPDRFLARLAPVVAWIPGRLALALWAVLVAAGLAIAIVRWPELTANISDRERAPAPGLGGEVGGPMVADPSSPGHDRPLDRFFAVDLRSDRPAGRIGQHVLVKFDLPPEPIAWRMLRALRQLTLRAFND